MPAVAIVLLAVSACGPRYVLDPSRAGPRPMAYRQIAMQYARASFFDPYSIRDASISVPDTANMYSQQGWLVCIRANAKNRMGAYAGQHSTGLLIYNGRVVDTDSDAAVCDQETFEPFPEIENLGSR